MFQRLCNTPLEQSFFLFGARGTGKSTLLKLRFSLPPQAVIDLLHAATERELALNPDILETWIRALPAGTQHVVACSGHAHSTLFSIRAYRVP